MIRYLRHIISDFWRLQRGQKTLVELIVPLVLTGILACLDVFGMALDWKAFANMATGAISIFFGFSIASITILVSSNNENLDLAKQKEIAEIDGHKATLFTLLLANFTFTLLLEAVAFILLAIGTLLDEATSAFAIGTLSFFLLFYALMIILRTMGGLYLVLFRNPKDN